jgi:sodium-dependent dicarboxylate transporter 2/3/5
MNEAAKSSTQRLLKLIAFWAGPVSALLIIAFAEADPEKPLITKTMAIASWMAIWWMTEAVPLVVTSLLPVVLFPALGIMTGKDVAGEYFNDVIFLFTGGFLVALAIQKWDLHQRIALKILVLIGASPGRILLGFMIATTFLSMWISNTATAMMMVPILLSILVKLEEINGKDKMKRYGTGMLLAVGYSASIGGIATIVGTPPNLSFMRILELYFPGRYDITFAGWLAAVIPITILLIVFLYVYLYYVFVRSKEKWQSLKKTELVDAYRALGPWSREQIFLIITFVVLILLWFLRADLDLGSFTIRGWSNLFANPDFFDDGTVAIFVGMILFLIPSRSPKAGYLMDWKTATNLPWDILLLFGGGFALASGIKISGLSDWIGGQLMFMKGIHPFLLVLGVTALITFLSEITSNTATVETFLPILAGLATSIGTDPLFLMFPATLAASMGFMLPVATPPNAIVFGTRRMRVSQMVRAGLFLDLVAIAVISLVWYFYGSNVL